MAGVAWFKILVGAALYAGAILSAFASSQAAFEQEIAAVAERVPLSPRQSLNTLARIKAAYAPLSPRQQALVHEQTSHAKFYAANYSGALADGKLLEDLGKQQRDKSIECLGLLSQVYASWMLGKYEPAYEMARRAERFSPAAISATARVKTLLTRAQAESEERQPQAALRTVAEALLLASAAHDETLLFMATRAQANMALAANESDVALTAVNRLLVLAKESPYRERMVRAKSVEYAVASAAGLTSRASDAMAEKIRLIKQLGLDEMLGRALVDYSALQLKSNRYADAAALTAEALGLDSLSDDARLANTAHFNHAIATIHLGRVKEGKAEVERLFKSNGKRADLLDYLPEYVAALNQAGEVDASVQAAALHQQIGFEEALHRAKESAKARGQIDSLSREGQLNALEASKQQGQRNLWVAVAISSAIGLIALLCIYGRLRKVNRLLEESNRQLYTSSNRDSLTGLFNRRYVDTYVSNFLHDEDGTSLVSNAMGLVVLMDIDNFKELNDTYGHAVGDAVLQVTADRLSALFRADDVIVRWGGEEFLALLPVTPADEAGAIAARVLAAVSAHPVVVNKASMNVTISVGICRLGLKLQDREMSWEEVVHMADQALYLAKQNGRNMAYGVTNALDATSADMARGLRINWDQGKVELVEVFGDAAVKTAQLKPALT